MKVATVEDDKIIITEADTPKLDGKGAIIKTLGCGLCGSDIVKYRQSLVKNGSVLGHEVVGEIVAIDSDTKFKLGDRIISSHHIPCFECIYCKSENYSMCKHFKATNIRPGGFSEYVYLSEEHLKNVAHLIPENLTEVEASFYEPLGCCIRAVRRAELLDNSNVLVIGLGSIGLLMAQALKAFGMNVWGCDILPERIDLANKLGIHAINSNNYEQILKDTKIGVDGVFMTSGADVTIELALKAVRSGGKIMVFASTPKNFGYANNEIYYRELTVMGSYSPAPVDLAKSLELLADEKVVVKGLSTEYEFEDIQKAFCDTIENKILKAYIKINKEK